MPRPFFLRLSIAAAAAALAAGCAAPERPADHAHHHHPHMPASGSAPVGGPAGLPPGAPAPQATGPVARAGLIDATGRPAGEAILTPTAAGLDIAIEAQGLTPGLHGFHVHANGECAPGPDAATGQVVPFGAAGGHFDPGHSRNHGRPGQPMHEAHAGELPNLEAGPDGRARLRYVQPQLTLAPGKTSVMGRTLVVHAQRDDYESDPAGDSGGRVLCGLIGPAQPSAVGGRATFEGATVFPEGIAVDARTGHAYVGSSSEGHLYRIPAGGGRAELFQTGGSPGRQAAYGMQVDPQGRLWVAGGPHNTVSLVDLQGATTVAVAKGPAGPQAFLNDLVMARDGMVYVTDAFRPVVFRMRSTAGAALALEPWLDLSATPVRYVPNEVNFNGIVASPDGRWLLAVQTATGQLWRIDTRSRAVAQVRLEGGDLKGGDGLVLRGPGELFVVRNADNELVRVMLADGWGTGRIAQRINDPRFKYPTTAALTPRGLMVVNGQLDKQKSPPPLLPFDVLTVGLPQQP